MDRKGKLEGRTALVTGGGTGIGFGCARELAAEGARVTIAGRRVDVLEQAADRLKSEGFEVAVVGCDITEEDQVRRAVELARRGGNLDVLVANAGSGFPGAILQMEAAAWDFCMKLNVTGTALCIKQAGLVMKDHGGGSIVAISSTSGTKVQPWLAPYVVSKRALDMLVRCAAVELAPHGIRVNSVQPGYVPTEAMGGFTPPELDTTLKAAAPLGRAGTPADIGKCIAFLASADAGWITGQVFGVDGGLNVPVMPSMGAIAKAVYGEEVVASFALPDLTALPKRGA
ncbi:SDR family oxidoreductase [Myxococcota bacterium]|nr:SDR family oxidoreductase [Myxococcota bacterium]